MSLSFLVLSFILFFGFSTQAANLDCDTLYPLMTGFLAQHLSYKKFTPDLEQRTINQFVKNLDPSKLYLLDSDVDKIKGDLKDLFSKVGSKKCDGLDNAQKIYEKRVGESQEFAKKTLNDKFKLDENTTIVIDPAKRNYAKTESDLQDLQSRYIQFQISNYLTSDMKLDEAKIALASLRSDFKTRSRFKGLSLRNILRFFRNGFRSSL